jgi:hypothetical protein
MVHWPLVCETHLHALRPTFCCRRYFRFYPDGTLLYRTSPLTVAKVAKSLAVRSCGSSSAQAAAAAAGAKQKLDQHVFTGKYVIKVRPDPIMMCIKQLQRRTLNTTAAGFSCQVV